VLSDTQKYAGIGKLDGPTIDSSIHEVLSFIEKHLLEFCKQIADSPITNEKGLTQKLCIILNNHSRREGTSFWFHKEYMEEPESGTSPQVDMGIITTEEGGIAIESKVYGNDESFFSLEAKRLGVKEQARQKEYLIGRSEKDTYKECGGVERFKKGIHGRTLKYGGLLGYVQDYNFDYWYAIINSWIDDLIVGNIPSSTKWSADDRLHMQHTNEVTARYKSINLRDSDKIILFHLWVNLVKKDTAHSNIKCRCDAPR